MLDNLRLRCLACDDPSIARRLSFGADWIEWGFAHGKCNDDLSKSPAKAKRSPSRALCDPSSKPLPCPCRWSVMLSHPHITSYGIERHGRSQSWLESYMNLGPQSGPDVGHMWQELEPSRNQLISGIVIKPFCETGPKGLSQFKKPLTFFGLICRGPIGSSLQ